MSKVDLSLETVFSGTSDPPSPILENRTNIVEYAKKFGFAEKISEIFFSVVRPCPVKVQFLVIIWQGKMESNYFRFYKGI